MMNPSFDRYPSTSLKTADFKSELNNELMLITK
ncbi:MAG: hypothetical protein ACI8YP_003343 [Algoriphagus sp.]